MKRLINIISFVIITYSCYAASNMSITATDHVVHISATLHNDTITMAQDAVIDIICSGEDDVKNFDVSTESKDVSLSLINQGLGRLKVIVEPAKYGEIFFPLSLSYEDANGQSKTLDIGDIKLNVQSTLSEEQIAGLGKGDIAPIIQAIEQTGEVEAIPRDYRIIIAAAGFVFLILIVCLFIAAKRKRRLVLKPIKYVVVHNIAYQLLDDLKFMNLPEKGAFKLYYANLSNILRYYIEYRYKISAPDMTTEEFLEKLSSGNTAADFDSRSIGKFLQICDMVKFAKYQPAIEQAQQAADTVKAFIANSENYQCVIEETAAKSFAVILEDLR